MPHNALYLPLLWLTQERQQKDRHRISQVGISDKRSASTLNHVGEHNYAHRKACLSPILWRCWHGEVNKRSSCSARRRFSVLLCWVGLMARSLAWELPRLPLRLQAGFRACHQRKSNHQRRKKTLKSVTGSVVFRGNRSSNEAGKIRGYQPAENRAVHRFARVENSCKKMKIIVKKGYFYLTNS